MAADLLRTPPLAKQLGDHLAKPIVNLDAPPVLTCPAYGGATMSIERPIPATGDHVAPQLPRDRRRRASKPGCDRPDAQSGLTEIGDLDALVLGEIPGADLADRQPIQGRDEPDHHTVAVDLVTARPVCPSGSRDTYLAGRCSDAPPPSPQLHEPLTFGRLRTTPRPLLHPTRRCQHNLQNLEKCCDRP